MVVSWPVRSWIQLLLERDPALDEIDKKAQYLPNTYQFFLSI